MIDAGYLKYTLPNGVRVLMIPMDGVNSVATSVMVGVGSRYEDPATNGISHFIEHMTFKGTKKFPTTDDVNIVEKTGGIQNAYTDIDLTNYHNKILAEDWEVGLEVNKEFALFPLLEEKHIDMERNVILEEMKRYEDEPTAKLEEAFHGMMYPGTKLGMRIIGSDKSLLASNGGTLRSYHTQWYTAGRMVVVVAGHLPESVQKTIRERTERWFESTPADSGKSAELVTVAQDAPRLEVITKPQAQQAHMELGFHTFARKSTERYAWSVFNILMGVSFTSRLFKEIREKRGLCYHIRSSSSTWAEAGYWSIYAGIATDKVEEATRAILGELAKVRMGEITEEEVAIAKKRIKTLLSFKSEDPEFFSEYYGRQEIFGDPIESLDEYIAKIEAVTREDIEKVIKKYLVVPHINMALVWNKPKDENLAKLLTL